MDSSDQTIRVLFLASNPRNTEPLRLAEEIREIEECLLRSPNREIFILSQRWAVRPMDLRRLLLSFHPTIVHFSGHSQGKAMQTYIDSDDLKLERKISSQSENSSSQSFGSEGVILEDENGNPHLINAESLANLFKQFKDEVKCVILNSCFSCFQAEAIFKHIPHVIGMKKEIEDRAAIKFSQGFYDALGAGRTINGAYLLGKVSIQSENIPGHLIPILYSQNYDLEELLERLKNEKDPQLMYWTIFKISKTDNPQAKRKLFDLKSRLESRKDAISRFDLVAIEDALLELDLKLSNT